MRRTRPVSERFWEKVNRLGKDDCWEWRGTVSNRGYGRFYLNGRTMSAHRVAYELCVGEIRSEALDHLCRNRSCVNPGHLEQVSQAENQWRGMSPTGINSRKTRCPSGHDLSGSNLIVDYNGKRRCRTCTNAWKRAAYKRDSGSENHARQ